MASQSPLLSELLNGLVADTWKVLEAEALFEVIHDRDMVADRYFRKFIRHAGRPVEEAFPRDCDMLLPRGSYYAPWKGAVSFDILPVWLNGKFYASFATHLVLPHPSRQAYITSRIFLIDATSSDAALRLARELGVKASTAAKALPDELGPWKKEWMSPFNPRYLNLIAGFFKNWCKFAKEGEWQVMRTFCPSSQMRPECMAHDLRGYISSENLGILRGSHRKLVNSAPPDAGRHVVSEAAEPGTGEVSPAPLWAGMIDELIVFLRSITGAR